METNDNIADAVILTEETDAACSKHPSLVPSPVAIPPRVITPFNPKLATPRDADEIAGLHRACKNQLTNDDKVVIFCGAGVTMGAHGKNGSWSALLHAGVQYAQDEGIDQSRIAAMRRCLANPHASAAEWLQVGEDLTAALNTKSGLLKRWLTDRVENYLNKPDTPLATALAEIAAIPRARLATTNYDFLLELAMGWKSDANHQNLPGFTWMDKAEASRWAGGSLNHVYHVHGHARQPDSIVLGTQSYSVLTTNEWVNQLRIAMGTVDTVFFVGCGATLQDPAFLEILNVHYKQTFEQNPERKWFQLVQYNERVGNEHLTALPYGADHSNLPIFLRTHLSPWLKKERTSTGNALHAVKPAAPPAAIPSLEADSAPLVLNTTVDTVPSNVRDTVLKDLKDSALRALAKPECKEFCTGLAKALKLDTDSSGQKILEALDAQKPLRDQLLNVLAAMNGIKFTDETHPIEEAATALYFRAAIAKVNLEMAAALGQSSSALMVVPHRGEAVIAILVAALQGEVPSLHVEAQQANEGEIINQTLRIKGLIDADEISFNPLQEQAAIAEEVAKRVDKSGVLLYRGDWTIERPTDEESLKKWHCFISDSVQIARKSNMYFRLIGSNSASSILQNDETCKLINDILNIPITRYESNKLTPIQIEALLGISADSMEIYFGNFLVKLSDAKKPVHAEVKPSPSDELLKIIAALPDDHPVKIQLEALRKGLEANNGKLNSAKLKEILDLAKTAKETGGVYIDVWTSVYEKSKFLLDLLI